MKTGDRVISFALVGVVVGAIWFLGTKLHGERGSDAATDAPSASASSSSMPSASASGSASGSASAPVDASVDAGAAVVVSAACRAWSDQNTKKLDDAKTARPCIPALDMSQFVCHTSPSGTAWAFRVDDVIDLGNPCKTGWLVSLVNENVDAGVTPGIVALVAAGARDKSFNVARDLSIEEVSFFDWDGDGEDEVFVRAKRTLPADIVDERAAVWALRSGDAGPRIAAYEPTVDLTIFEARDVDGDGRPDLLVTFFRDGRDAPPSPMRFVAHSLLDGTFSLHDTVAITWAEKLCPKDPKLDLTTKKPADFDHTLGDEMVCALLWGHTSKELTASLDKACQGVSPGCPSWARRVAMTKPPLSLR